MGNVIKPVANDNKCQAEAKVTYAIHSKKDYISRLAKVFTANQKIDLKFSGFRIMRHPTMDGIYGVTLRQQYKSDRYADDGYLSALGFPQPVHATHPRAHLATGRNRTYGDDVISIQDFNLE